MSDFPFSIPRREAATTNPFNHIQTNVHGGVYIYDVPQWNGSNEVKLTALSGLTITPTSSSQKVVLDLSILGEWNNHPMSGNISLERVVGGSSTFLDNRGASGLNARMPVNAVFGLTFYNDENSTTIETLSTTFVDTPNTTAEVTYNVYLKTQTDAANIKFFLNRCVDDSNANFNERATSTFTVECKGD
tara:strand:+ start:66 stop:632 length:567 start_codon:yes stop_codon:yes gene_type:complete